MKSNIYGIIPPVVTPLDNDENIDETAYRKLLRYLIKAGVHGLFVGGSASEGPLLTVAEWIKMMEIAYDEVKGVVPLLGGAMDTSTRRILEKIKILKQIGYQWIVVAPSYYISLQRAEEHLRLFGSCYEAVGENELIVYNMPACVGSGISIETMQEMARRGWMKNCKDSSANIVYFKQLIKTGQEHGFQVFLGGENFVAEALIEGAAGIVAITANYEPQTFVQAYEAWQKLDIQELIRLDKRIWQLREKIFLASSCWISGTKYALSTIGLGSERISAPLQGLEERKKQIIDDISHSCCQRY